MGVRVVVTVDRHGIDASMHAATVVSEVFAHVRDVKPTVQKREVVDHAKYLQPQLVMLFHSLPYYLSPTSTKSIVLPRMVSTRQGPFFLIETVNGLGNVADR